MKYTSAEFFYDIGKEMMEHRSKSRVVGLRRFKSFFGISPKICAISWELIKRDLPSTYKPTHLLWTLFFLKNYNTEHVNRRYAECDEKTFRLKIWTIIDKLAFMKVVRIDFFLESVHILSKSTFSRLFGKTEKHKLGPARLVLLHWMV